MTNSYVHPALNFTDSIPYPEQQWEVKIPRKPKNNVFHFKLVFKYVSFKPSGKMEVQNIAFILKSRIYHEPLSKTLNKSFIICSLSSTFLSISSLMHTAS